jgi:hypothetical protein
MDSPGSLLAVVLGCPDRCGGPGGFVPYLLTEGLQADQDLDGVLVVNPFVGDPRTTDLVERARPTPISNVAADCQRPSRA